MDSTSPEEKKPKTKGFASMKADQIKAIASLGGKAVSSNKAHMAEIGRKGGSTIKKKKEKDVKNND